MNGLPAGSASTDHVVLDVIDEHHVDAPVVLHPDAEANSEKCRPAMLLVGRQHDTTSIGSRTTTNGNRTVDRSEVRFEPHLQDILDIHGGVEYAERFRDRSLDGAATVDQVIPHRHEERLPELRTRDAEPSFHLDRPVSGTGTVRVETDTIHVEGQDAHRLRLPRPPALRSTP